MQVFEFNGLKVTHDDTLIFDYYGVNDEIQEMIGHAFDMVYRDDTSAGDFIKGCVEDYPGIPHFKSYLAAWYKLHGKHRKSREMNEHLVVEHPDFIHGRLQPVIQLYENGLFHDMLKALGDHLDIERFCGKEVYHISEILAYQRVSVLCLCALNQIEKAEEQLKMMKILSPNHPDTEAVIAHIEAVKKQHKRAQAPLRPARKEIGFPDFQCELVKVLYEPRWQLQQNHLNQFLEMDRESLALDLIRVLKHSRENAKELVYQYTDRGLPAAYHAIILLQKINYSPALHDVLMFLNQSEDNLRFWFNEEYLEDIWEPVSILAEQKPDILKGYCLTPGMSNALRSVILDIVTQTGKQQPVRIKEMEYWLIDVTDYLLQHAMDQLSEYYELGAGIVYSAIDLKIVSFKPHIRALYEKGFIQPEMCGTLDEVMKEF